MALVYAGSRVRFGGVADAIARQFDEDLRTRRDRQAGVGCMRRNHAGPRDDRRRRDHLSAQSARSRGLDARVFADVVAQRLDSLGQSMTRIGTGPAPRQIALPISKAIEIAWKSIRQRLRRSLLVTSGIVLAIAFLMAMLTTESMTDAMR